MTVGERSLRDLPSAFYLSLGKGENVSTFHVYYNLFTSAIIKQ